MPEQEGQVGQGFGGLLRPVGRHAPVDGREAAGELSLALCHALVTQPLELRLLRLQEADGLGAERLDPLGLLPGERGLLRDRPAGLVDGGRQPVPAMEAAATAAPEARSASAR